MPNQPTNPGRRGLEDLSFHLGRAYLLYEDQLATLLRKHGLSRHLRPGMGHVLFALFAHSSLTLSELSQFTLLANSTLTGLIRRMETGGLLTRVVDAEDRRAFRVSLTPLGQGLRPACLKVSREINTILAARLTPGESEELERRLILVCDSLRASGAGQPRPRRKVSAKPKKSTP